MPKEEMECEVIYYEDGVTQEAIKQGADPMSAMLHDPRNHGVNKNEFPDRVNKILKPGKTYTFYASVEEVCENIPMFNMEYECYACSHVWEEVNSGDLSAYCPGCNSLAKPISSELLP